ncbi:MAG: Lysophospholipase [Myxococcaceae bacterium]|nr:Lysophospholipase [Myxococcaceae bacterium]
MTIELDEGTVTRAASSSGPSLYYASAMPTGGAKAVLAVIHGYADHGARYAHVMGALAEHGIGSVAIDLRGHGRAQGSRGFCTRFDEYLDDARELRSLVDARAKGAPTLLFGHSFGGLVATLSALDSPGSLKGLVLSAPFFGLGLEVPRIKVLAGKIASRVYPKLGLPSGLEGKDMTHDPAKAKDYDADPLVFKNATARWFTEATGAQQRALASASRLTMPLYMTFGTADKVASMPTAKRFFDAAGSADKTWDPREGLFHELLNEPSWKDTVDNIARWTLAHA